MSFIVVKHIISSGKVVKYQGDKTMFYCQDKAPRPKQDIRVKYLMNEKEFQPTIAIKQSCNISHNDLIHREQHGKMFHKSIWSYSIANPMHVHTLLNPTSAAACTQSATPSSLKCLETATAGCCNVQW